ncbi:MAG: hypothetical protein JRN68_07590 [Nitrososphaerota archaeon]|nr:hypothetical protein [Nitrososphaerota archaeon]
MIDEITNEAELKKAKSQVNMTYAYVKSLREEAGSKLQVQVDREAESLIKGARELKAKIKAYEANRPPSQFMEVKHRHLVSEADRMVMKFSHLLEESLGKKIERVGLMAKNIPGNPYAPGADPMKRMLIEEVRVLKMVMTSVAQARDQFTADAVEYHTKRYEEKLALGPRPKKAR